MKLISKQKKAFTLIELLIVIAIIGILFIVLVSKVDFATDKAKASGVQTDFRSFQAAFEMVSKENAGFNTFGWDTGDNAGAAPAVIPIPMLPRMQATAFVIAMMLVILILTVNMTMAKLGPVVKFILKPGPVAIP